MLWLRFSFFLIFGAIAARPACAQWQQINGIDNSSVTQINGIDGISVTSFAVVGTNVYAGTNKGVILSTDSGISWNYFNSGLTDQNITAMFSDSVHLYAGTSIGSIFMWDSVNNQWDSIFSLNSPCCGFAKTGPFLFAASQQNVASSTDPKTKWKFVSSFTSSVITFGISQFSELFAGTIGDGVLSSLDFGNSWQISDDSVMTMSILSLATLGNVVFAGTNDAGTFRSLDDGDSWEQINNRLPSALSISAFYINGTTLFAGTNHGIYYSTDSGTDWNTTNLSSLTIQAICSIGDIFLAGSPSEGIARSTDGGMNWNVSDWSASLTEPISLYHSRSALFAGQQATSYGIGAFRSSDDGETWHLISLDTGLSSATAFAEIDGCLFMGMTNGLAGPDILYKSTDEGLTWTTVYTFQQNDYGISSFVGIGSDMFVATLGDGIFLSTNTGQNWSLTDPTIRSAFAYNLVAIADTLFFTDQYSIYRSNDGGTSWKNVAEIPETSCMATMGNVLFAGSNNGGIFRTSDCGNLWLQVDSASGLNDVIYSFQTVETNLFAGTGSGVYLSTDSGVTWKSMNEGLIIGAFGTTIRNLTVDSMYLFATADVVENAGDSYSVWRRPLSEMVTLPSAVAPPGITNSQLQCYPNPFSQSVTISFAMPSSGYAEVSIVNMLGVEIARIFSGELSIGNHTFVWNNSSNLQNGTYRCICRTDGQVLAQPIVVLR